MSALRFLLCIPKRSEVAAGKFLQLLDSPGEMNQDSAALWCSDHTRLAWLPDRQGVIIGRIFSKGCSSPILEFSADASRRIADANGTALIETCWGSYIAVLRSGNGAGYLVVRDPSGSLPCYRMETEACHLWASDLGTFIAAGFDTTAVQWDRLFQHLQASDLRQAQTCVDGVFELAPGAACKMEGSLLSEEILWSPWRFTEPDQRLDPRVVVDRLHDTVCETISALARDYRHIIVGVSGGLDSSIVCAALAAGGHRFSCLTAATEDPSGDERRYALAVADATGAGLSAHFYDPHKIDITRSAAAHLPRPIAKPFMQELERAYAVETAMRDADAIFTGNGGDNVFCFVHSAAPIVDRLRCESGWIGLWRTLLDMCSVTQCDVLTMLRATAKLVFHRQGVPGPALDQTFLNKDRAMTPRARLLTPYMDTAPAKYPGKRAHVNLLMRIQNYVEGYDRVRFSPVMAPLLAQPIVEICLRIPTWEWCAGGINRSAARRAFADSLPQQIIRRTSKSGPDSLTAVVFERNRKKLRGQLLGGVLREREIIDGPTVEHALSDPRTGQQQTLFRLLDLADAEAWARSRLDGITTGTLPA